MESPPYYVPVAAGVPTPEKVEVADVPVLRNGRKTLMFDVLAGPQPSTPRRDRWSLPVGKLAFTPIGLIFMTAGKRINPIEQFLGGKLYGIFKNLGTKAVEPMIGGIVGEQLVKTLSGVHEWQEIGESVSIYSEGRENREALFFPINRIVSLCRPFERNNTYGIFQLNIALASDDATFATYEILAREEDDAQFSNGFIPFTYFLRLNYEQRIFQGAAFRKFGLPSLEIPADTGWSLNTLSFSREFYEKAAGALQPDAPSVDVLRRNALEQSRPVIAQLASSEEETYNLDLPSGKLFDLIKASAAP